MSCARARHFATVAATCAASFLWLAPARSWAGGGPENVFLVANSRSWASLTIANHFAALRQIPEVNILRLDWPYSTDKVDVELFRDKLLVRALGAIQQRGLGPQIDYIVYSSDFPWSIDFKSMLGKMKLPEAVIPIGSITSLTFFASWVAQSDYRLLLKNANHYMRGPRPPQTDAASHGFRNWYGFDVDGKLVEGGGDSYILSTMLGITSNEGMSADEVVSNLTLSASADGTKPNGTIYYCKTGDAARSGPREPQFIAAVAALKKLGISAEIVSGIVPQSKKDVAGLLTGKRNFDWKASQSAILPGALCENFTSNGAIFSFNDGQQRLTDFLLNGAAGSSGTVIEPLNFQEKFPTPFVQVHYARGCTLAESFYQSVACPYQLLVVGDPLCRPWANIPTVVVDGVIEESTLRGTAILRPHGEVNGKPLDRFELYVEGSQVARCATDGTLELDTTQFPDGAVELRIVGIEAAPIESQGRLIVPVRINNNRRKIEFTCSAMATATWNEPITLSANSPDAQKIVFLQGTRTLGTVNGKEGEIEVKPEELGLGPVTLRARAHFSDSPKDAVLAKPVTLTIEPGTLMPAQTPRPGTKLAGGMQFKAEGNPPVVVRRTNEGKWLSAMRIKPDQSFTLAATFDVPEDGMYQFEVKHVGPLSIKIDGKAVYDAKQKEPDWNYVPAHLAKGLHYFQLGGVGGQPEGMEIRFGGSGATDLDETRFRHPTKAK
jgi:hypothetical protein